MRWLTSLVLAAAVCFAICARAQPVWEQCVPINGVQFCAVLDERTICNFHIKVTASPFGITTTIIDQEINMAVAKPTACGTFMGCEICFDLYNITRQNSQNVSACAEATDSCLSMDQKLGCFTDSTGALAQCVYSTCPNGCSGNGKCVGGICDCDVGYSGADCSEDQLAFHQCLDLGSPYGQACMDMEFEECSVTMLMTVSGIPVYKTDTPITAGNFGEYFAASRCVGVATGCQGCLGWSHFQLNKTFMTGCPSFNMSCLGMPFGPYLFDCFTDARLAPACFGDCPAGCSGHGTCNNGVCACNDGYSGSTCDRATCASVHECSGQGTCVAPNTCSCLTGWSGGDCSVAKCDSVNGCSGHGKCTAPNKCACDEGFMGNSCETPTCKSVCYNNGQCIKGECVCTNGWTGSDCSTKAGKGSSGTGSGVYIGVGVAVGLGLAAVGGGGFLYWRKRQNSQRYGPAFDDGLLQVPTSDGEE